MTSSPARVQLTPEFSEALEAMRGGENVLITGNAGTGKSTLLRMFLAEQEEQGVLVTAPTGVAALNVNGFTIHRAFGFRPNFFPEDLRPGGRWSPSANVKRVLKAIRVLVIDEISMVRAEIFDMMDIALRSIRRDEKPFGGVQLILVGDLLQLPPVVTPAERDLFTTFWDSPYYFSAKVHDGLNIKHVNLTRIWRQSDSAFIEILNEVREGSVGEQSLQRLNQQVDSDFVAPNGWVTLAARNQRVAAINAQRLNALTSTRYVSHAVYAGEANANSFNGTETLEYARGARVMTLINDPAGRFVNGSFGEIIEASPEEVVVQIDGGDVVALRKHTWEVGRPVVIDGKITSSVVGSVTQFPLNLAWAITIHKSQGQTIPKLFIDLTGGTSQEGQFYVALSRGVDLENIRLSAPVGAQHIRASNELVRRVRRASSGLVGVDRVVALSAEGVDFSISQHVARIHAVVVENGQVVSDFGSWINPAVDLGEFGERHDVPSGGLALAPSLGDFWPLLLRQAEGAAVVGDNLLMIERAVRHQEAGMSLDLGVGYDTGELGFSAHGDTPAERARSIADAIISGELNLDRGEVVPTPDSSKEGAVYLPSWAPQSPMKLDLRRATESDIAWASLSGGNGVPTDVDEVQECLELMGAWATSRGKWDQQMRDELLERAHQVLPANYEAPPVLELNNRPEEVFSEGTRVAFTGRKDLLGGPADDERLMELCRDRGLIYKRNVSKTQCDVLVAGDPASMSRKAQAAREFGKPIVEQSEFERWYSQIAWAPEVKPAEATVNQVRDWVAFEVEDLLTSPTKILRPGTRVSFRGSTFVYGNLIPQGEKLQQFCADIGLEYKQAVTKTRCDVLVTDDPYSVDGKSALARRYGIPMVTREDFSRWAEAEANKIIDASTMAEGDDPSAGMNDVTVLGDWKTENGQEEVAAVEQVLEPETFSLEQTYGDECERATGQNLDLEERSSVASDRGDEGSFAFPRVSPQMNAGSLVQETGDRSTDASQANTETSGWRWTKRLLKALGAWSIVLVVAALLQASDPIGVPILLCWLVLVLGVVISGAIAGVQAIKKDK